MFNFLLSLIIASQFITPLNSLVDNIEASLDFGYPRRVMTGSFEPVVETESAIVLDMKSGKVLYQKQAFKQRPIASISKLMTALVFLENEPDMEKAVQITQDDRENGGSVQLMPGEVVKLKHVLNTALIGSVNTAAYELAFATDLSYDEFIDRMNSKARELGMENSVFVEPTGISPKNQSTAREVAILLKNALENEIIYKILSTDEYYFTSESGKGHLIKNTNNLLGSYLEVIGGKTGYIDEAGFCLVNLVRSSQHPEGIIVAVLGAKSKQERDQDNKWLAEWVWQNWEWAENQNAKYN